MIVGGWLVVDRLGRPCRTIALTYQVHDERPAAARLAEAFNAGLGPAAGRPYRVAAVELRMVGDAYAAAPAPGDPS